jgi:hypothetical protein
VCIFWLQSQLVSSRLLLQQQCHDLHDQLACRFGLISYVLLSMLARSVLHSDQAVATWRAEVSMQRAAQGSASEHRR